MILMGSLGTNRFVVPKVNVTLEMRQEACQGFTGVRESLMNSVGNGIEDYTNDSIFGSQSL